MACGPSGWREGRGRRVELSTMFGRRKHLPRRLQGDWRRAGEVSMQHTEDAEEKTSGSLGESGRIKNNESGRRDEDDR